MTSYNFTKHRSSSLFMYPVKIVVNRYNSSLDSSPQSYIFSMLSGSSPKPLLDLRTA